jgi:hypothetical protein
MRSWLKRLLGQKPSQQTSAVTHEEDYQGYRLQIQPRPEAHQYRVAAKITKIESPELSHDMIRADLCPSQEIATEQSLYKARQAVDQLGDRLFHRTPSS